MSEDTSTATLATATEATAEVPAKEQDKTEQSTALADVHARGLKRFWRSDEYMGPQIEKFIEDLKFGTGEQWPADMKKKREDTGKPCLVINLMREKLNQVKGEWRQNKPQIKVIPYDNDADPETADILNGHIRAILNNSDAELAFDTAFDSAVDCGMGAFRAVTEYEDDMSRDQVIKVERVENALSIRYDPGAKRYDKQDGRYMHIYHDIPIDDYKAAYPGKSTEAISTGGLDPKYTADWVTGDTIRVAEYFEKQTDEKYRLVTLTDGRTIKDGDMQGDDVIAKLPDGSLAERRVKTEKLVWYKLNGNEILEGPRTFPSKYYPIFFVWGEETNINGERHIQGMIRPGMDSQRSINYWESKTTEVVALQPVAPWQATPKQIPEKYQRLYNAAASGETVSVLYYEPDELAPQGSPSRVQPPTIPTGMENRAQVNKENLKSAMGIYNTSVGAQSNETSGKAINARDSQASRGTFHFPDNMARSFRTFGNCLLDMIPRIYDADRTVRILGLDGEAKRVHYGQRPDGYVHDDQRPEERIYDPQLGKYDVTIAVGPSYATRRQEASDTMSGLVQSAPLSAPILIPRIARQMDFPDSDDIADELEIIALEPEQRAELEALRSRRDGGQAEGQGMTILGPDGLPVPPDATNVPQDMPVEQQQPPPDPGAALKLLREQGETLDAIIELKKKWRIEGFSDEQIDAGIAQIKAAAGIK